MFNVLNSLILANYLVLTADQEVPGSNPGRRVLILLELRFFTPIIIFPFLPKLLLFIFTHDSLVKIIECRTII